MKTLHYAGLLCLLSIIWSCTTETIPEDLLNNTNAMTESSSTVTTEATTSTGETGSEADEACFTTTLIAGQHYAAGIVSVAIEDGNLIITYSSNGEWEIGITHLSVGNCEDGWVPLNGGGNPRIGRFEYTEPTTATPYEVVYVIPLEDLNIEDTLCFAAHAEVQGPTGGETAWAEGEQFDGNGWAMFVQTDISDCGDDGDDDDDNGDGGNNGPF